MQERLGGLITAIAAGWIALGAVTTVTLAQDGTESRLPADVLPPPVLRRAVPGGLSAKDVPLEKIEIVRPPHGAPNVVIVLLDDAGFGAAGTFGGPIPTPELDRLAKQGLRYNRFHTTSICSPTRAALLTGRNHHAVGMGNVMNAAAAYPGYDGIIPKSAATIAEVLRQHGYSTSAWGKWHLTPDWETSAAGPFDRWPTGMGFEKFYGFTAGETDQFEPTIYDGTTYVGRPRKPDYHLTEDLAEHAIAWMRLQRAIAPDKPFFVYLAPGATHAPLQAPRQWIERFKGQFDQGWDKVREETFARQKRLGVIPASAQLTPRLKELPAWDSLSGDEKKVAARLMEAYAGFLAHTDAQVGRLMTALEQMGAFDNTLFFFIVGDNGASAEGGLLGTSDGYLGGLQGFREDTAAILRHLDQVGGPSSAPHYPAGWAWAMDTPFQWTKQIASHLGGTRNPLVVSWPKHIRDKGGLRSQFTHVTDVMPTILEAAGVAAPALVNGVQQQRMDGVSLLYTFDDAAAKSRHRTQYFEILGNRAVYHDGWIASAYRGRPPWAGLVRNPKPYTEDVWELYNLDDDYSQARNLAKDNPRKLRDMQDLFWAEFAKNKGLPLHDDGSPEGFPRLTPPGQTTFTYDSRAVRLAEAIAPDVKNRSFVVTAEVDVPATGAEGVLVAEGGTQAGWSLYVNHDGKPVYTYSSFGVARPTVVGKDTLPVGKATVRLDWVYDGGGLGKGATAKLSVNGKPEGEVRIDRTVPILFGIDETFDVGTDTGTPVGDYPVNFAFTGQLRQVRVELK
ncbi:MAG: arylsulfatase [Candidatus Binatia bacterium]